MKRILEHDCMNCTLKHLATARELLYRKNDMIMVLGHLACAFNHSGIAEIDDLLNRYMQISPADVTPVIKKLNLEQAFQHTPRTEQSSEQQCIEYLAISAVIAMEIATGYSTDEYHAALLGNLSIAQDLAVLKNAELANRIRGIRRWLYPDGVRIAKFRAIDIALIKDMANNNFNIEDIPMETRIDKARTGKPCGSCGKKRALQEVPNPYKKILILGSGLTAPLIKELDVKDWYVIAINNAWRLGVWNALIYPCDFKLLPSKAESINKKLIDNSVYLKANAQFGFERSQRGNTMSMNAGYYALSMHPEEIAFLGVDMVYNKQGNNHFYGNGSPDPLRLGEDNLDKFIKRFDETARSRGVKLWNLSPKSQESRLPFARLQLNKKTVQPVAAPLSGTNDIVIPLSATGSGHDDLELRYALRAIEKNLLNYRDIIIVSDNPPKWLKNVRIIKHPEMHRKAITLFHKWQKAAQNSDADNIILWTDDEVLMRKVNALSIPVLRIGIESMFSYHGKSVWHRCLRQTAGALEDKGKPAFNCESHTPTTINRLKFIELEKIFENELSVEPGVVTASLYHNYYGSVLQDMNIFKATFETKTSVRSEIKAKTEGKMFIGYSDVGFESGVKEFLQERFPDKSKYEKQ